MWSRTFCLRRLKWVLSEELRSFEAIWLWVYFKEESSQVGGGGTDMRYYTSQMAQVQDRYAQKKKVLVRVRCIYCVWWVC